MKFTANQLSAPEGRRSLGWIDIIALTAILGLLWIFLKSSQGMVVRFDASQPLPTSTDLANIPYYAARTLIRMWIAFGLSLLFTFSVGYAAAKNEIARSIILSMLFLGERLSVREGIGVGLIVCGALFLAWK